VKVVLDTNVFNDRKFLEWLIDSPFQPVASSVVYMEVLYRYARRKGLLEAKSKVKSVFESVSLEIMDFDEESAEIVVQSALGRWNFSENARDYMIGSLAVKLNAPLVTNNKKHFDWLSEVYTPTEFMDKFSP